MTVRERLVVQLQEQISTRTNIIIGSNSFLFMPFISSLTGYTPLSGYLLWLPIGICLTGIILNIFWVYSTFKQIGKRDSLIKDSKLEARFSITTTKESLFYDFFNKAAPILMTLVWLAFLGFYILQHPAGLF